jgi:hypothetical protein
MSDTVAVAIIGGLAAVVSTVIAFFGGRGSAQAQLQDSVNKGFAELLRLSKIENVDCNHKLETLRGEINGLKQYHVSLVHALHRAGVEVPKYRPVEVVFLPIDEAIPEERVDG